MTAAGERRDNAVNPVLAILRRTVVNLAAWTAALFGASRHEIRRLPWRPSRLAIGTLIAIAAVAVPMLLLDPAVIGIEKRAPRWLHVFFDEMTDFGKSGWFLWPSAILLVAIAAAASPALGRIGSLVLVSLAVRVGFVFLAIGIPGLFVTVIKRLIGRARPPLQFPTGPYDYVPFAWRVEYASLPSGHATTAFSVAVALGALFPRARMFFWIYACLIALSRVILAAHYPSDVIAGAVVGAVGALLVRWWFAIRRLGFTVGTDGRVRALPGPSLRRIKMVAARLVGQ